MIKTFVKRIWLSIVLSSVMMILGGFSFLALDWNATPVNRKLVYDVLVKTNTVSTSRILHNEVTAKLSKFFKKIPGIAHWETTTEENKVTFRITFLPNIDEKEASTSIGNALLSYRKPDFVEQPTVTSEKVDAVVEVYFSVEASNHQEITEYVRKVVQPEMEKVKGVSMVEAIGVHKKYVSVLIDEKKAAYYGVSPRAIKSAIAEALKEQSLCNKEVGNREFTIEEMTPMTAERIENIIVIPEKYIKIKNIATIAFKDKVSQRESIANGNPYTVKMFIYKENLGNLINISNDVIKIANKHAKIKNIKVFITDNAEVIRKIFKNTIKTFIETVVLTIIIIYAFLGSFKASISPILAIPISILSAFLPMRLLGCSINETTLMAIILAVGLVVDDAIIVVENIVRKYANYQKIPSKILSGEEKSKSNWLLAAINGTNEILWPIIVMTLTLAFVFIPVIISTGTFKDFLKEFAITLVFTILISGIVSLTLTPMLGARFNGHNDTVDRFFKKVEDTYRKWLQYTFKIRSVFLVIIILCSSGVFYFFHVTPQENIPSIAKTNFRITTFNIKEKSHKFLKEKTKNMIDTINKYPEIKNYYIHIENAININVDIKEEFSEKAQEIRDKILKEIKEKNKDLWIDITNNQEKDAIEFFIYSPFLTRQQLSYLVENFAHNLRQNKELFLSVSTQESKKVGLTTVINVEKAQYFNKNLDQISDLMHFISRQRSEKVKLSPDQEKMYRILIETDHKKRPIDIMKQNWKIQHNRDGEPIYLYPADYLIEKEAPRVRVLQDFEGIPAEKITIMYNTKYPISKGIDIIKKMYEKDYMHLAQMDYVTEDVREFLSGNNVINNFALSILFIFLILTAQFNSLKMSLIVMSTAPLALFGAMLCLYFSGSINYYSVIGLITLVGLITKHGILFTNTANNLLWKEDLEYAVLEAASTRLRPVLMTTLAMVFGVVPLLIDTSSVMIRMKQLAIVIFPGMSFGTIVTLFVVPNLYYIAINKQDIATYKKIKELEPINDD